MTDDLRAEITTRLRAAGCVFAEDEAAILLSAGGDAATLATMVDRRTSGVPLEHVVGWADFCGIRVAVADGVFVPRPRSALLVARAAALAAARLGSPATTTRVRATTDAAAHPGHGRPPIVVDLCCGTGAIGVAILARVPRIRLHAADLDPAAVRCARANLAAFAGAARVYEGDLFAALPVDLRGHVSVLVANVPYVPTGELGLLPHGTHRYEPTMAFDGGPDGLDLLRRVAADAREWLAPGGAVLMETSRKQARLATGVLAGHGLRASVVTDQDIEATVVIGHR